jgi:hypothetical protein
VGGVVVEPEADVEIGWHGLLDRGENVANSTMRNADCSDPIVTRISGS